MRSGLLPDVPLVADFLPGFESSPWLGIAAPKDTPGGYYWQAEQGN
jgi:hypothetical protein